MRGAELHYSELKLSVHQLDWRTYDTSKLPQIDLVVASDIVFAKELHTPLSRLLSDLLDLCQADQPAAFLACTVREGNMSPHRVELPL